jgi:hypothetical protein
MPMHAIFEHAMAQGTRVVLVLNLDWVTPDQVSGAYLPTRRRPAAWSCQVVACWWSALTSCQQAHCARLSAATAQLLFVCSIQLRETAAAGVELWVKSRQVEAHNSMAAWVLLA